MRRTLLLPCFSTILAFIALAGHAQNDRFAYAVTDLSKDGAGWNAVRKLDLQTGTYSNVLFNGTDNKVIALDAISKKPVKQPASPEQQGMLQTPFGSGVAAMAYDKKHNRLYFTPMFVDQLRYLDLATMKLYQVSDQPFTKLGNMHGDEGKIVTRMVIAPDGQGYAVTNDGKTFIRFTTGKKPKIMQLGALINDEDNGAISVHERKTSFGGDMIADDDGNLYIITAHNHIFKVSTSTRIARHLGSISGLPAGFTINGAVVDAEGSLLVSSAVDGNSYFVVDTKEWKAAPFTAAAGVYRSSDLANSNFLPSARAKVIETIAVRRSRLSNAIQVYPNPVITNTFTVQFSKVPPGRYTLQLNDAAGHRILQRQVTIVGDNQTQTILLSKAHAKGMYLIKIVDNGNKAAFEQKVLVQ